VYDVSDPSEVQLCGELVPQFVENDQFLSSGLCFLEKAGVLERQ
jgi:hypothetical protein